jgi:phage FluMu protein Com
MPQGVLVMFKQTIVGAPLQCLNRTCKASFYRESHLGYYPKNEVEVYAVVKCPKCKDTFAIVQPVSIVHEYKNKLPKEPKKNLKLNPITQKEIDNFSRKMADVTVNPLSSLYEGLVPGASDLPED